MKPTLQLGVLGAVGLSLALLTMAGCAGPEGATAETEGTVPVDATETAEPTGVQKAGLTTVDMVDCSICAIARSCCNAVSSRTSYCNNFNADRCATLDPGRQRSTKLNCLTLLRTTISAWRIGGRTPPQECRIPGE